PGMTTTVLDDLFAELIPELKSIMSSASLNTGSVEKIAVGISRDSLWECGIELLKLIGYDFNSGRQDLSSHPFTISLGAHDVRITTRIPEDNPADMIWSCLHEGGHALYEQGLGNGVFGLPESEAASLGIHESQSRFWENHIG